MEKSFFGRPFCLLLLAAAQKIAHAAHSLSRLGELHVKAGYVSTHLWCVYSRVESGCISCPVHVLLCKIYCRCKSPPCAREVVLCSLKGSILSSGDEDSGKLMSAVASTQY